MPAPVLRPSRHISLRQKGETPRPHSGNNFLRCETVLPVCDRLTCIGRRLFRSPFSRIITRLQQDQLCQLLQPLRCCCELNAFPSTAIGGSERPPKVSFLVHREIDAAALSVFEYEFRGAQLFQRELRDLKAKTMQADIPIRDRHRGQPPDQAIQGNGQHPCREDQPRGREPSISQIMYHQKRHCTINGRCCRVRRQLLRCPDPAAVSRIHGCSPFVSCRRKMYFSPLSVSCTTILLREARTTSP